MKTLEAMWKRGSKHVVIGAAKTVVCYQGSGCLRQSEYSSCSWVAPRQVGLTNYNSVPCLAKGGGPSSLASRSPREQWQPRENGELPDRVSQFAKHLLSLQNFPDPTSLESKRTCKRHRSLEPNADNQNLLGSCLGCWTNILDESSAQSRLITNCWDNKIWWPEPFIYRLPKAISWSQHLKSSCLDLTDPQIKRSQVPSWGEVTPGSLPIPPLKVKPHPLPHRASETIESFSAVRHGGTRTIFIRAAFKSLSGTKKNCLGKERGRKTLRKYISHIILKPLI